MTTEYIEAAALAKLKTSTNVLIAGRFYPNQLPQQATTPCGVYWLKDSHAIDGTLTDPGDLFESTLQVDFYSDAAQGYLDVKNLALAVRAKAAAGGLAGDVGAWTVTGGTIWVQECRIEDNSDDYAPPQFDESIGQHAISLNLMIVHERPVGN